MLNGILMRRKMCFALKLTDKMIDIVITGFFCSVCQTHSLLEKHLGSLNPCQNQIAVGRNAKQGSVHGIQARLANVQTTGNILDGPVALGKSHHFLADKLHTVLQFYVHGQSLFGRKINADDHEQFFYDYIETCLIDYCGGYLRTRREEDKIYLDLMTDFSSSANQQIEFGINMLELTEEISTEDLFTVLIPLGDDNLTIESVNNGSDELVDDEMVKLYGRIVKTHVFENVNQPSTLLENGLRFLSNHANVPATITIRAVDMHLLDSQIPIIKIGDSVQIKSKPHNITRSLNCTQIVYDFENLGNCTFTFGTIQASLTERYRKDKNKNADQATTNSGRGDGAAGLLQKKPLKELEINSMMPGSMSTMKLDISIWEHYIKNLRALRLFWKTVVESILTHLQETSTSTI